jgi:hypothetical protein
MSAIEILASSRSSLHQVGVPRSAACVLAACAGAAELCPDLPLGDALSRVAFERLGGSLGQFDETELRCAAFRAFAIDGLARDFFARTPGALGVGIWPILGARAHRLDHVPWIDVDTPEMAELRRFVLPPRRGWLQLGKCLCHEAWIDLVCRNQRRKALFVLDESVLPIAADSLTRCLDDISRGAPTGSELIVAFDVGVPLRPCTPLRPASALEVVVKTEQGEDLARYPRLRFVDPDEYRGDFGNYLCGVNAVATLRGGVGAPALAHLRVI